MKRFLRSERARPASFPFFCFAFACARGRAVPFLCAAAVIVLLSVPFAAAQTPRESAAGSVPRLLAGVWENETRLLVFGSAVDIAPAAAGERTAESGESAVDIAPAAAVGNAAARAPAGIPLTVVLKLFYGWYYDRAAESGGAAGSASGTAVLPERDRNDAVSAAAEVISVSFEPLIPETAESGAWNMTVQYPGQKQPISIPIAVFGGSLYLDFMISQSPAEFTGDVFWKAASNTTAISLNVPTVSTEVYSLYRSGAAAYRVRYWLTDMSYDETALAVLNDGSTSVSFPKHLRIGSAVYTCVPGRGTQVRNAEKIPYDGSRYVLSADGRICVSAAPYAILSTVEDLYAAVEEANRRRKPPRQPPLPDSDLDFHYEIIEELRKYAIGR